MKKVVIFIVLGIFLTGFVAAISITGSAAKNNVTSDYAEKGIRNQETSSVTNKGDNSKLRTREENRLRVSDGECPENCTCTGSVAKCRLQNGKELTVTAGKSGNTIIQIQGENLSTTVQLYKSEGKLYGDFNGETKEVRAMPDQIREKIRERLRLQNCSCKIELHEDGNYEIQTEKRARFLGFIPVNEKVNVKIDSATGEITRLKNSWWGFLASDVDKEQIVGASCGTVTLGYNDECCQNKGYDYWNSEKQECLFNAGE
jgi:hypothetical protein